MSVLQFTEVANTPVKINVSPMFIWLSFSMILQKLTGWILFFWSRPWEKKGQITFTDAYFNFFWNVRGFSLDSRLLYFKFHILNSLILLGNDELLKWIY